MAGLGYAAQYVPSVRRALVVSCNTDKVPARCCSSLSDDSPGTTTWNCCAAGDFSLSQLQEMASFSRALYNHIFGLSAMKMKRPRTPWTLYIYVTQWRKDHSRFSHLAPLALWTHLIEEVVEIMAGRRAFAPSDVVCSLLPLPIWHLAAIKTLFLWGSDQ